MNRGAERKPLLGGRGLLSIDDFARATGLDQPTVEALVQAGELEGVVDLEGRAVGLFNDVLPTSDQLRAMGLAPDPNYNPDELRSYVDDSDDPHEHDHDEAGPTWTMSWPDGTPE